MSPKVDVRRGVKKKEQMLTTHDPLGNVTAKVLQLFDERNRLRSVTELSQYL